MKYYYQVSEEPTEQFYGETYLCDECGNRRFLDFDKPIEIGSRHEGFHAVCAKCYCNLKRQGVVA